jgi:membrane-bound serine protease (ClpP class)
LNRRNGSSARRFGRSIEGVGSLLVSLALGLSLGGVGAQTPATVALLDIEGPIGPATSGYVERGFETALDQGAALIVLRLDTPGGLVDSTRTIIQTILASPVPVVGFVAPSGAHAASAGTYILYACHIAAMAPGTNLGAATPVQLGGERSSSRQERRSNEDEDDAKERSDPPAAGMEDKIVNDAVAYIRSLAQMRNRNVEWAEQAVREAASLPAGDALAIGVVDLLANDLNQLLAKLDGRVIQVGDEDRRLDMTDRLILPIEPDWRTELLSIITNPNVAYILMLVGIYGIIFEFYSPGMIFPGVAGVISLLLALYAFQVLPVNYAGLGLVGLAIALMVAELMAPSFGALGVGGVIAFVVGSIMLMDTDAPGFGISWPLVGGVAFSASALLMLLMTMLARSRARPLLSGSEDMIGRVGQVLNWSAQEGRVRVHGEIWSARGPVGLKPGQSVEITAIDGLTLEVEPKS